MRRFQDRIEMVRAVLFGRYYNRLEGIMQAGEGGVTANLKV